MATVQIQKELDEAYRTSLLRVAPDSIRPKIRHALIFGPTPDGLAHAQQYFGEELAEILKRAGPLLHWLDEQFEHRLNLKGLTTWFTYTGFGNCHLMIKALDEWAQMKRAPNPPPRLLM